MIVLQAILAVTGIPMWTTQFGIAMVTSFVRKTTLFSVDLLKLVWPPWGADTMELQMAS